jgi:hypothetical protein
MDEVEQRFVVKYFFIKGWGSKKITAVLETTFHHSALSRLTVKRWITKFKNGDSSCDDNSRSDIPISILGQVLQKFFDRYPFSSTRIISKHFRISPSTVKEIVRQEMRLRNSAEDEFLICFLMIGKSYGSLRHGSYCLCWK